MSQLPRPGRTPPVRQSHHRTGNAPQYNGHMEQPTAEDLDRYVDLVDHELYARQGIVIHAGVFPDDNAPHGMNDEEEMV